jgi:uncharacterized OB-fold protein
MGMDFLGDLLDFGDRKDKRGHRSDDDHHDHDDGYDRRPLDRGCDNRGRVPGTTLCVKCSVSLLPSFKFCPNCATPVSRVNVCSSCGAEFLPQSKFCGSCGVKTIV